MKKLLLLPLVLLLAGCSNDTTLHQWLFDAQNDISIINWQLKWINNRLDMIENIVLNTGMENEELNENICVWLTDISVATYQAKDVFECIWEKEWYCSCIEKYASCGIDLWDLPKEVQNKFNPPCFHQ